MGRLNEEAERGGNGERKEGKEGEEREGMNGGETEMEEQDERARGGRLSHPSKRRPGC